MTCTIWAQNWFGQGDTILVDLWSSGILWAQMWLQSDLKPVFWSELNLVHIWNGPKSGPFLTRQVNNALFVTSHNISASRRFLLKDSVGRGDWPLVWTGLLFLQYTVWTGWRHLTQFCSGDLNTRARYYRLLDLRAGLDPGVEWWFCKILKTLRQYLFSNNLIPGISWWAHKFIQRWP